MVATNYTFIEKYGILSVTNTQHLAFLFLTADRFLAPRDVERGNEDEGRKSWGGGLERISAHYLLSAYFLTVYHYKCMRLITRVYGVLIIV